VLWTLTVELSFYFFIPLVLLATRRIWLRVALVTSLAAGSLLLSGTYMANTANAKSPIFRHMDILVLPYFWIFAVGVLFAILRVPERLKHKTAFIFGLGALMVTMAFWREDSWILWKSGAEWTSVVQTLALGAFIVLLGSTRIFYFGGRLDNHDLSYGLYLWHMLVVTLLMKSALVGNPWALLPAYAGAFALAWLSWATVEQRFLLRREPRSFEAAPAE
jgi:peptidoglycan/LPS O-acetylase OafA/YrhL